MIYAFVARCLVIAGANIEQRDAPNVWAMVLAYHSCCSKPVTSQASKNEGQVGDFVETLQVRLAGSVLARLHKKPSDATNAGVTVNHGQHLVKHADVGGSLDLDVTCCDFNQN